MTGSYNFRLHDAVLEALQEAVQYEINNLANDRDGDISALKMRIGKIVGLKEAIVIAQNIQKKTQEN